MSASVLFLLFLDCRNKFNLVGTMKEDGSFVVPFDL